jgi:hypothetical protein
MNVTNSHPSLDERGTRVTRDDIRFLSRRCNLLVWTWQIPHEASVRIELRAQLPRVEGTYVVGVTYMVFTQSLQYRATSDEAVAAAYAQLVAAASRAGGN